MQLNSFFASEIMWNDDEDGNNEVKMTEICDIIYASESKDFCQI